MASEWAKEAARDVILRPEFTGTTRIYIHIGAHAQIDVVSEALDAARIKGLEEAAEIVQQQTSILATVPPVQRAAGYADAVRICTVAIRAWIKEAKG